MSIRDYPGLKSGVTSKLPSSFDRPQHTAAQPSFSSHSNASETGSVIATSPTIAMTSVLQDNPITDSPDILQWPYIIDPSVVVASIVFNGPPLGKKRPRFTRSGHVYTDSATRAYERALRELFLAAITAGQPDDKSLFGLRCFFFRQNRQRIDCDNLLKAVSDAANKVIWKDDSQVVEVFGKRWLAQDNAHMQAVVYLVPDPSPSHPKCPQCGKIIVSYKSRPRVYCSKKCANAANRVTIVCRECEQPFTVAANLANKEGRKGRLFCSQSCSMKYARRTGLVVPPARRRVNHLCVVCGAKVSRKEYTRCNVCRLASYDAAKSRQWKTSRIEPDVP